MQIQEVTVKCACCGSKSVQYTISECVARGYMDLDTRPPEERRSALEFEVQECPQCHYCNDDISLPIKNCSANEISSDTYRSILADSDSDGVAKKFLLCGYLYQKAGNMRTAGLQMLRMAWRFDDLEDFSSAKDAREMAIAFYKEANDVEYDENTALLVADMTRRIGDFWNAATEIESAYRRSKSPLVTSLLNYEKRLVTRRDSSAHDIGERPDAGN